MGDKKRYSDFVLTLIFLSLPLFREQYNGGQFVTWHRPIVLMAEYVQEFRNVSYVWGYVFLLVFSLVVYAIISVLTKHTYRMIISLIKTIGI